MTLRELISKTSKYGSIGLAYMTVDSFISNKINGIKQDKLNRLTKELLDTKENCNNYLDYIINDELLKTQIFARLNTLIELRKKK